MQRDGEEFSSASSSLGNWSGRAACQSAGKLPASPSHHSSCSVHLQLFDIKWDTKLKYPETCPPLPMPHLSRIFHFQLLESSNGPSTALKSTRHLCLTQTSLQERQSPHTLRLCEVGRHAPACVTYMASLYLFDHTRRICQLTVPYFLIRTSMYFHNFAKIFSTISTVTLHHKNCNIIS